MSSASTRTRPLLKRLALLVVSMAVLALGAAAIALSTRDYEALRDDLVRTIERELPGTLKVGKVQTVLLPFPQVVFEQVELATIDGRLRLATPRVVAAIDAFDLFKGRLERPDLRLESAAVTVLAGNLDAFAHSPRELAGLVDALTRAFDGRPALAALRVTVQRMHLTLVGAAGPRGDLAWDELTARLRYDRNRGRLDARAQRADGEAVSRAVLSLPTRQSLETGGTDGAFLEFAGAGSRFAFSGRVARTREIAANGAVELSLSHSIETLLGFAPPRGESPQLNLAANAIFDARGAHFEGLRITRGAASLAGIAALRENGGRWNLSSTLAGDLVDGSATDAALRRLTDRHGAWSTEPLDIDPLPGVDLDIRVSTRSFRIGGLNLDEAALSIFTRPGRLELALGDARFGEGQIKARASLVNRGAVQELKLSLSGERLDAGGFLDGAFGLARLKGRGSFIIQAESFGSGIAEFARNLSGSGTFDVQAGEIAGIDLARLVSRIGEAKSEAALIAALGGRSPFEAMTLNLVIRNGVIEPVGTIIRAPRFEGSLEGSLDLAAQRHQAWVLIRPRSESGQANDVFAVRIDGPLFAPQLRPDPAYLLKRS